MRYFLGFGLILSIIFFNSSITKDTQHLKTIQEKIIRAKRFEELLIVLLDTVDFISDIEDIIHQKEVNRIKESIQVAEKFLSTLQPAEQGDEANLEHDLNEIIIMLSIDPITKLIIAGRLYRAHIANVLATKELENICESIEIDSDIKLRLEKIINNPTFSPMELKTFLIDTPVKKLISCESNKNFTHYVERLISNFRVLIETILNIITVKELKELKEAFLKLCDAMIKEQQERTVLTSPPPPELQQKP